jgi:hypothetical protein
MTVVDRLQAIEALASDFSLKYPDVFKIHKDVQFQASHGGIGIQLLSPIQAGEILLVIPHAARITYANTCPGIELSLSLQPTTDKHNKNDKTVPLTTVVQAIGKKVSETGMVDAKDATLMAILMYVLQNPANYESLIRTWPSPEDLDAMVGWTESELDGLKGTHAEYMIRTGAMVHDNVFESVLQVLQEYDVVQSFGGSNSNSTSNNVDEHLRDRFVYAWQLTQSRCHDGKADNLSADIIPLVEMLSGAPEHSSTINVQLQTVTWNEIKDLFQQDTTSTSTSTSTLPTIVDDDTHCSLIVATQFIPQGSELVLSYGTVPPSGFLYKYGYCPEPFLQEPKQLRVDTVSLCYPPELLPDVNDLNRIRALQQYQYPATEQELTDNDAADFNFVLSHEELKKYQAPLSGLGQETPKYEPDEPEALRALRRYIMLAALGTDQTVTSFLETQELQGQFTLQEIGRFLLQVVDYNLDRMASAAVLLDITAATNKGNKAAAIALYQKLYREALCQWRHAICRYFQVFSAADDSQEIRKLMDMDYLSVPTPNDLKCNGCSVCGSTFNAKRCARCKQVAYCCKEHQTKHWKLHKIFCVPIIVQAEKESPTDDEKKE